MTAARGDRAAQASFRTSLVPMVIADDDRRYVAVNHAACLLLRLSEADALRLRVDDLTPSESRAEMGAMWEVFLAGGTQRGTFEMLMPDGPRLTIEYSATANIEPGRHLSILMFPPGEHEEPEAEAAPAQLLTAREREVLSMVAMGMGSAWIASALGVSASTVETHVRHCVTKLGARNRAHAIALGLRAGEIGLDLGDPAA
jgi:DNA-binding CsgD family transcriptional regulator